MTSPTDQIPQISPQGARALQADGALLLDVREDNEWFAGHADEALHVPLGQIGSVEFPHERTVLVVCRSGGRSSEAVAALTTAGVQAVNVDGGMTAWAAAGLPMVSAAGGEPRVI